jgi:lipopolysaccharide transport system permease protein
MKEQPWDLVIKPKSGLFELHLGDLWRYRDLLMLFVKRDIVAVYKQTLLGPFWFFVQPILTALTFTVVFGKIAGLPTDGKPQILFYLAGNVCWNYFADCLNNTSNTFVSNANIFGKVYFPRLISPLSVVISNMVKFLIQLTLFIALYAYFLVFTDADLKLTPYVLLLPLLLMIMALLGLGFGLIISSFTTKYRDLRFLISFGVQLMMYATPIIYPLSTLKGRWYELALYNPMTSVIETFKYSFFGSGILTWSGLAYSAAFAVTTVLISVIIFNKVEKSFMDTV